MTTIQRFILMLLLIVLMGMGVTACTLPIYTTDQFSINAWRKDTGFKGEVCVLPSVEEGSNEEVPIKCLNGVKPTNENINGYMRYLLWYSCEKYSSPYACASLNK
jgi:hypothetical protein